MSLFTQHVVRWQNCKGCDLCQVRKKVVLSKGQIPCSVLFIGEAPGMSEDVHGIPFYGPAGKLLEQMIQDAGYDTCDHDMLPIRRAYTNIIACIPKESKGSGKFMEPPQFAIDACKGRLIEFVKICNPLAIVAVGDIAKKWLPKLKLGIDTTSIIHPASILRADISQRSLLIHRTVVALNDIVTGPLFQK